MARVIVYHSYYGCDTGCCGHTVELTNDDGTKEREFRFGDCWETGEAAAKAFAEEMVRHEFGEEHVKDLDWDNCVIYDSDDRPLTKKEHYDEWDG